MEVDGAAVAARGAHRHTQAPLGLALHRTLVRRIAITYRNDRAAEVLGTAGCEVRRQCHGGFAPFLCTAGPVPGEVVGSHGQRAAREGSQSFDGAVVTMPHKSAVVDLPTTWPSRRGRPPALRARHVCRAGFAGGGTAFARSTERRTLTSDPDPRQGLGPTYALARRSAHGRTRPIPCRFTGRRCRRSKRGSSRSCSPSSLEMSVVLGRAKLTRRLARLTVGPYRSPSHDRVGPLARPTRTSGTSASRACASTRATAMSAA